MATPETAAQTAAARIASLQAAAHDSPVYAFVAAGRLIHESLYRNSGHPVAIVATGPDATGRWAAYIGPAFDAHESEEETLVYVARQGTKLERDEAARMLRPELVEHLGGAARYRD